MTEDQKNAIRRSIERWLPWLIVGLAIACALLGISVLLFHNVAATDEDVEGLINRVEEQQALIDEANDALRTGANARRVLERQIRSLGEKPKTPTGVNVNPFVPVPGEKGEKGDPGETVVGPAGPEGPRGPQGPMFPVEQAREILRAFFSQFCAENDCIPEDGEDGADGRGIDRVECNAMNRFVVHYTDGAAQVVRGSQCRRVLIPTPTEEENE